MKVSKMDRKIIRAIASMEGCTYGKLVDLVVDDRMVFISALGVCAAGIGATMVWAVSYTHLTLPTKRIV